MNPFMKESELGLKCDRCARVIFRYEVFYSVVREIERINEVVPHTVVESEISQAEQLATYCLPCGYEHAARDLAARQQVVVTPAVPDPGYHYEAALCGVCSSRRVPFGDWHTAFVIAMESEGDDRSIRRTEITHITYACLDCKAARQVEGGAA